MKSSVRSNPIMNVLLAKDLVVDTTYCPNTPAILYATKFVNSGGLALMLVSNDGINEPLAKISLNIQGVSETLPFDEFVCKSYSENEGMEEWLVEAGIATETGKYASFGHADGAILKLAPQYSALLKGALQ